MSSADVQTSGVPAGGGRGGGGFPKRQLNGDLKLRLSRLPSLGGGGHGDGEISRRGSAVSSRKGRSPGLGTDRSTAVAVCSSRRGRPNQGDPSGDGRKLSLASARDGFRLVPTTGNVAVHGGVDSSRLNWKNPASEQPPVTGGSFRGGSRGDYRRTSRSGGSTVRSSRSDVGGGEGGGGGGGGGGAGPGSSGGSEDDSEHREFLRELGSQNGLQLRCSRGQDERTRHQREVQRRIEIQENCIRRPSVCQSKSLLKAKILGSIGGGPFELLRAFRKMHCGRGTVIDVHDFREAVQKLSLGLTEPEILDFFRSFDADGSGGIDFTEFCEWVGSINEDGDGGGGEGGFRPSSAGSDKSVSKRKMRDAQAKVKAASEKVPERTMAENEQLLREKILGSIGGGPFQLLRAFRKMHRGRGTVVDLNDFREAVKTFSLGLGEPEVVAFFNGFDADGSGGIDFEEFCAWVGGDEAAGGGGEQCLLPESKPTNPGGFVPAGDSGGADVGLKEEEDVNMTPAQKAQQRVNRAFRAQAGKMSSETLHKVLREKLITTVKPGGGTLLRTYHNLHRSGNVGGVELGDFKEAVHRYGMGVTDAQVEKLFRRYDKDGSGDIDFHEFLKLIMYAEELAPEEEQATTQAGPDTARDRGGGGEGIRPLSPGWATRVGKQGCSNDHGKDGRGNGGAADEGNDAPADPAKRDRPGGMDGSHGGGAGVAAAGAREDKGAAAALRGGGRHSSTPVLGRSPVTMGAKAEEKVLAASKAMQTLGKEDVAALASKHAASRGSVDYPRFMRHLLLRNGQAGGVPAGGGGGGDGGRRDPATGRNAGRDCSPRPCSPAAARAGLRGSKSTGALAAAAQPDHQSYLRPIARATPRDGGVGAAGGGGGNDLRGRAMSICRELQPHIINVWKALWKDLKAADKSTAVTKAPGGGVRTRFSAPRGASGISSGEVETHVFSSILARHGLELSNRDLMALEHLPAMPHKGWALPPGVPLSSSATARESAAAGTQAEDRKGSGGGGGGSGRIPYDSFLTMCLVPAVR